jgi:hypothetical protein
VECKETARGRLTNLSRLLIALGSSCYGFQEQKVVCPYKSDHHVSPGSFQKHTERCRLKSLGIDPDVEASTKLESSSFGYKDSERVVTVIAGKHMYHLLSGNEVIN